MYCIFSCPEAPRLQADNHGAWINMNKNMAPKLPNLPYFEAFGVIFCPDVGSYFCLVCGGGGHQRISEKASQCKPTVTVQDFQWRRPAEISDICHVTFCGRVCYHELAFGFGVEDCAPN